MKFGFNWPSVFLRKRNLEMMNLNDLGQLMTLTFDIHKASCTNLVAYIY